MCIIMHVPKGVEITEDTLQKCWSANPDGAGYMFAKDGRLTIRKPFFKFEALTRSLQQDMERVVSDFVIHFRITTSGKEDKLNTHPHRVNSNLAVVHNGILSDLSYTKSAVSDTVLFARSLGKLRTNFLNNPSLRWLVESYAVNNSSKFVFMDNFGRVTIMNRKAGTMDAGVWYSNTSYKWGRLTMGFQSLGNKCPICGMYSAVAGELCYRCLSEGTVSYWYCANKGSGCFRADCTGCKYVAVGKKPVWDTCLKCGRPTSDESSVCSSCRAFEKSTPKRNRVKAIVKG